MHNRKSHEYFLKVPIITSSQELQWKESHLPVTESFSILWLRLVALPLLSTFFFFLAVGYFKSHISTLLKTSVSSMPDKGTELTETY